jgi:hypothetical protein
MRAAARLKAPGCGITVISSGPNVRARLAPPPYHIGSPVASTTTRRPRHWAMRSAARRTPSSQVSRSAEVAATMF